MPFCEALTQAKQEVEKRLDADAGSMGICDVEAARTKLESYVQVVEKNYNDFNDSLLAATKQPGCAAATPTPTPQFTRNTK